MSQPPAQQGARGRLVTPRQARVLDLLVDGATNEQIARSLGIGIWGVKQHLGAAHAALGARNRTHLAVLWDRRRRGSVG